MARVELGTRRAISFSPKGYFRIPTPFAVPVQPLMMALVTQQFLTKIGVKVDLQSMDWGTLVSRRAEKKAQA
jgi:ABC-type transport system substrate-binding protein